MKFYEQVVADIEKLCDFVKETERSRSFFSVCDVVEFQTEEVKKFCKSVVEESAKVEDNMYIHLWQPIMDDLGVHVIFQKKSHAVSGVPYYPDYLTEEGFYKIAMDLKSFLSKDRNAIRLTGLVPERLKEKVEKYLVRGGIDYLVITNMREVFLYSRQAVLTGEYLPFHRMSFLDFLKEFESKGKSFLNLFKTLERKYPLLNLDKHFFERLKEIFGKIKKVVENDETAFKLLNSLIFLRTLEDTYAVNYRRFEEKFLSWERDHGVESPVILEEIFRDINLFYYNYFDTELFNWQEIEEFKNRDNESKKEFVRVVKEVMGFSPWKETFCQGLKFYDFSLMDEDIFGKAYEMFLAENRKEEGIFYTPAEITDFIVKKVVQDLFDPLFNELSAIIKSERINSEEELKRALRIVEEIKIIDPACGSGSFLIKVVKHLFSRYRQFYEECLKPYSFVNHQNGGSSLFVTDSYIRKRIENVREVGKALGFFSSEENQGFSWKTAKDLVTRHIYGIDRDAKALQIAKLNLWKEMIKAYPEIYKLDRIRGKHFIFPDLSKNFVCMDSIASSLKDWNDVFCEVFEKGGFSAVIGNPPYIRHEKLSREYKEKLEESLGSFYDKNWDTYICFYYRAFQILKEGGILGFITSNKWLRADYGSKLRELFSEEVEISEIIDFSGYRVFKGATVDTMIFLGKKKKPCGDYEFSFCEVKEEDCKKEEELNLEEYVKEKGKKISSKVLSSKVWSFIEDDVFSLKKKIESVGKPLKDWDVKIYRGILTGFNDAFIINTETRNRILANCKTEEERKRTEEIIKPVLKGEDIKRWRYEWAGLYLILIPAGWTNKNRGKKDPEQFFKNTFPSLYSYFMDFKTYKGKSKGKGLFYRDDQGDYWWELRPCNYYSEFEKEKIVWQEIVTEPNFAYDDARMYCEATSFIMTGKHLKYLLAILNSKPATFFFRTYYAGGGLGEEGYRYKKAFLEQLPIPPITPKNQHIVRQIEDLVSQILSIVRSSDCEKDQTKQEKVRELEEQIDELVYQLYDLTEEEIKLIEKEG